MTRSRPTVVVTQSEGGEGSLAASLRARGAEVLALPTISIEPPEEFGPLDRAIDAIDSFDWIVFTSRHAVEAVCARPGWLAARDRSMPTLRVAAVGKATAASLAQRGVSADLVPAVAGASGVAALLASLGSTPAGAAGGPEDTEGPETGSPLRGQEPPRRAGGEGPPLQGVRVLWPCSDIARRELPEALRRAGAIVTEPVAYRTARSPGHGIEELQRRLESGTIDAIAFMSPSSARGLAALLERSDLGAIASRTVIASIGPTTSAALRELEAPPAVESASRTAEDLAATLLPYLSSRREMAR